MTEQPPVDHRAEAEDLLDSAAHAIGRDRTDRGQVYATAAVARAVLAVAEQLAELREALAHPAVTTTELEPLVGETKPARVYRGPDPRCTCHTLHEGGIFELTDSCRVHGER